MTSAPGNRLKDSASPYLRSAAHQPVDWHEWGEEAFQKARAESKPILLDIGAVWCHWCHVIDRESYENPEIAAAINQLYIPVKVDRDERPDVDARYQSAISAISGQGGWPLTAFLTPDGKPFFGGTYFPPEDAGGRPGLQRILHAVSDAFKSRRAEVDNSAQALEEAVAKAEIFQGARGVFDARVVDAVIESACASSTKRMAVSAMRRNFLTPAPSICCSSASRPRETRNCLPWRKDARRHGSGRRVRPTCRRISPLFGGRALVRSALRENVL